MGIWYVRGAEGERLGEWFSFRKVWDLPTPSPPCSDLLIAHHNMADENFPAFEHSAPWSLGDPIEHVGKRLVRLT